jgi:hypothetical protein
MRASTSGALRVAVMSAWLLVSGCAGMLTPSAAYQANPQLLALAPVVVFQGGAGPMSYQTAVGRDGKRYTPTQRVRGSACQRGIQLPILAIVGAAVNDGKTGGPGSLSAGWGSGTFAAAVDQVRKQLPAGAILYDVQADLHQQSYLSVYRVQCVRIDAGVMVPVLDAPTS